MSKNYLTRISILSCCRYIQLIWFLIGSVITNKEKYVKEQKSVINLVFMIFYDWYCLSVLIFSVDLLFIN